MYASPERNSKNEKTQVWSGDQMTSSTWQPGYWVAAIVTFSFSASGQQGDAGTSASRFGSWTQVTAEAAFSPRDTAEGAVFKDKMWLSNGYYHDNILTRDLWSSTDGVVWALVNSATPYDGYSELVVFDGYLWAIKGSVWRSADGVTWEQVLEHTPFGVRSYGEVVVFDNRIWQLGSGPDVWRTTDGVNWTCVAESCPYGERRASAVAVYKNKLWLMGGCTPEANDPPENGYDNITTHNDVWCSPDGVEWTCVLEQAPWAPRQWFIAETYRDRLWIVGGHDNVNSANFGDVWYTEDGEHWLRFDSSTTFSARHEPTLYAYQDSLWMVAGNSWPVLNDVWRLTLPPDWPGE